MTSDLDDVLRRVAAGELPPDEALRLIDVPARPADDPPGPDVAARPPDDDPVRRLVLRTPSRNVEVWGDPSVAEVAVNGNHLIHRDGDALVIENPGLANSGRGRFSLTTITAALSWAGENLVVRANPDLLVDLDASASSVRLHDLRGGLRLRLLTSSAKIERVSGTVDIEAISSSVKGDLLLTGQNRIDCESSSVKVTLGRGSDVHIRAVNRMGKVILPSSTSRGGVPGEDRTDSVIGAGTGSLTIDAVMSSVTIGDRR